MNLMRIGVHSQVPWHRKECHNIGKVWMQPITLSAPSEPHEARHCGQTLIIITNNHITDADTCYAVTLQMTAQGNL